MGSRFFGLKELVHPDIYNARGEAAWQLLDVRAVTALDRIRAAFGPTICNDWHVGGSLKNRGLRPLVGDVGALYSQHRFGRAFDSNCSHASPQEVYAYILRHPEEFPEITTMEDIDRTTHEGGGWLHFDVRWTGQTGILIVQP